MKKQTSVVVILTLLSVATSCSLLSPSIETTWHITKIELAPHDMESESMYTNAFLSFYENDVASFFNTNKHDKSLGQPMYRIGQWKKNEHELKLMLEHTTIDVVCKIVELSEKWLVLKIVSGTKESIGTILKCQRSDLYRSQSFDLLAPKFNTWRAKPKHKENHDEIKARVIAHVDFLIGYFNMVDEKSLGYFEPSILQTPLQFYSNGIGLPKEFETGNVWPSNFYDEEDALAGGRMLAKGLASIEIYPSDQKSFTKGYYNALKLINEYIEK